MHKDTNSAEVNPSNGAVPSNAEINLRGQVMADAPDAIRVENIVKRYGTFTAVEDISFAVKEGEIFGLLGPNGAGKSTLIRMMTTLIPITGGSVTVEGHDVAREPDAVRRNWRNSASPH
jgi:ABC-type multidrug transport system, ATPase component